VLVTIGACATAIMVTMANDGNGGLGNEHPALARCWHPLARSHEVGDEPRRFWLLGRPWVAVRLAGQLVVLSDQCPHRLAPLSAGRVVGEELECAYHGWRFRADGRANCVPSAHEGAPVPSRAWAAKPWGVNERDGLVFVSVDEPVVDLPVVEMPHPVDEITEVVHLGPYEGRYGAALLIDNQIDMTHFAFLHRGTFGSDEGARPGGYEVRKQAWGFTVDMSIPINAANDPGVASNLRPLRQYRLMRYRYHAPFHLTLTLTYPLMGGSNHLVFWAQPQAADRCRLYCTMYLRQPGGFGKQELAQRVAFEERVVSEDLDLQGRFDRLSLPLDLTTECHVKADAASIEYRRLLQALVAAAGQAQATRGDGPPARSLAPTRAGLEMVGAGELSQGPVDG
jgi:phenylpropionate dioxygenase-like ring-hydroxylating dioxygenase large terminal subunit